MPEPQPDPELTTLEAALARLSPAPPTLNRDAVLYRAGRAAARPGWVWPLLTAFSSLVAIVLAVALTRRPVIEQIVYLPIPLSPRIVHAPDEPEPPASPPAVPSFEPERPLTWPATERARLEQMLLRWGLDAFYAPPPVPARGRTADELLRDL